jgi:hypothetical protein
MKKIVLMALASLPALAFAQTGKYTVQGTIGALNAPAKIYLQFRVAGKTSTDSVVLKDGKFQFTGNVGATPVRLTLSLTKKEQAPVTRIIKGSTLNKGPLM